MRHLVVLLLAAGCWHDAPVAPPAPIVATRAPHAVHRAGDAPAIELAIALRLAHRYLAQNHVDLSHAYLQGAVFDARARRWSLSWQVPNVPGALTVLYVTEAGVVGSTPDQ